jgi:hypothetical protein
MAQSRPGEIGRLDPRRLLRRLNAGRERAVAAIWGRLSPAELKRFTRFACALSDGLENYRRR